MDYAKRKVTRRKVLKMQKTKRQSIRLTRYDQDRLARLRATQLMWEAEREDAKIWDSAFYLKVIDTLRKNRK